MRCVGSKLAFMAVVAVLTGCGQPICIVGIGKCDHYTKVPLDKTPGSTRPVYTLSASATVIPVGGGTITLKLTSTSTVASGGSCSWELLNIPGSVGGSLQPDATPVVSGAICTTGFRPTTVGNVTVKVTEKSSSFVDQTQITVTN